MISIGSVTEIIFPLSYARDGEDKREICIEVQNFRKTQVNNFAEKKLVCTLSEFPYCQNSFVIQFQ